MHKHISDRKKVNKRKFTAYCIQCYSCISKAYYLLSKVDFFSKRGQAYFLKKILMFFSEMEECLADKNLNSGCNYVITVVIFIFFFFSLTVEAISNCAILAFRVNSSILQPRPGTRDVGPTWPPSGLTPKGPGAMMSAPMSGLWELPSLKFLQEDSPIVNGTQYLTNYNRYGIFQDGPMLKFFLLFSP